MPLKPDEIAALVPDVERLIGALTIAFRKDADGKVRITREEQRRIGKAARDFGLHLLRDVVD